MLLRYAELFRVVWMAGRYGGGKTSLAVKTGYDLVEQGSCDFLAVNFPLFPPWRLLREYEDFRPLSEGESRTVIIFDEAWSELGLSASPQQVKAFLAYLRKRENVLLMPSVIPLAKSVRVVQVRRVFNGFILGLPLWLYRVSCDAGERKPETFFHWWWHPADIWPMYDHRAFAQTRWGVYALEGVSDVGILPAASSSG